jgi:pimeloyl-ACP methyl ester carboxylesterase
MLAYDRRGRGEPLVLIHGISHRRQAWAPVMDQLAEQFDVIAVDLPGHGDSPAFELRGRTVRETLTQEFRELFDHLGVDSPHLAGNSLGALVALEIAEAGMARSVTALAPAGFWLGPLDFLYVRGLFAVVQTAARLLEPIAPTVMGHPLGRALALGWGVAHPRRIDPEAALGDTYNMIDSRDAIRTLFSGAYVYVHGGGECTTTIAWGTRDLVLLPYHALKARRLMPHAVHEWLPGCGHIPMVDDPDLVVDVIVETANRVPQALPASA